MFQDTLDPTKPDVQEAYAKGFKDFPVVDYSASSARAYKRGFLDAQTLAEAEQLRLEVLERSKAFGVSDRPSVGFWRG